MVVSWGDLPFEEPMLLKFPAPSSEPGVFAVMTKPDPQKKPQNYRVIYFGVSDDFSKTIIEKHPKAECWQKNQLHGIYYELYKMSMSTSEQRKQIQDILVQKYDPVCNEETYN